MSNDKENRKKIPLTYWRNQDPPQNGTLYEDPLFPPNKNSLLGLDSTGKPIDNTTYNEKAKNIDTNKISFARASSIFGEKYQLFSEKIEMGDVIQGQLGDCYFLSSVANLCKFPSLIMNLFKTKETNKDGFYEIILHIDGKPQTVIVDDYLPIDKTSKKPCYAQSKGNEIWVMLLEKAWAKVNGGYANIISGLPSEALEFLIGLGSLSYDTENADTDDINEYKNEIIKNVQIADESNCLISCSTSSNQNLAKVGLVEGHAYTLISFHQIVTSKNKDVYLFKIRNPWSQGEWSGDWSDKSSLWDTKAKSQVEFEKKEDGIFFMNDTDFFKYFTHIEICYILYDAISATYTIEGDNNLKNASVFNVQTEGEGFLSVSVPRKSWRANRELKDKILPTHISIVKYDSKASSRYKTFSNYNGTFESYQTCALNIKVTKGDYLIYVYRDIDHAQFSPDKTMDVKITCSAKFKHAQMSYDDRDKGFPLLQNIILQAEFIENQYDPDYGEDFDVSSNQLRGNGIGHIIFYISTPGYYLDFTGGTSNVKNFIMLSPYVSGNFHRSVPSGKYLVLLGLMNGLYGAYSFNCFTKAYTTNKRITLEYDNNDIDLTLYTDINNDIKNENVKERKTQSLERAKKEFYFDIGDGKVQYTTLDNLKKAYSQEIKLLDEVELSNINTNLRWGIMKGEYVTYVGQFNGEKKEGKGLFITPNNVFAGEFKDDQQNGIGYTYNKDLTKLFSCNYVNGVKKGKPITPEEEDKQKEQAAELEKKKREEEIEKQKEELKKMEEEAQEIIKKQEEEAKIAAQKLEEELKKAEEEKKAQEALIQEQIKKAEEEAKKLEEEKKREIEKQKEELEKLAQEEKKKLEEAEKQAEEYKKQQEEIIKKQLQEAEEKRKQEEEKIKAELEKLAKEKEEESKKKAEELKRKEEELKKEAKKKEQEAKQKIEEAKKEAEKKAEELKKEATKKTEEAKKKANKSKEEAENKIKEMKEQSQKKAEDARKQMEETKKKSEQKTEELKKKSEAIKNTAQKKANEAKQKLSQTREKAEKAQNDYKSFLQKSTNEMNQRKLIAEQRVKDQKNRMEQMSKKAMEGNYGVKLNYTGTTTNKKKSVNFMSVQGENNEETKEQCVTCGCSIY